MTLSARMFAALSIMCVLPSAYDANAGMMTDLSPRDELISTADDAYHMTASADSSRFRVRSLWEIINDLDNDRPSGTYSPAVNFMAGPWVLYSYRHLKPFRFEVPKVPVAFSGMEVLTNDSTWEILNNPYYEIMDIMDFSEEETVEPSLVEEEPLPVIHPMDMDIDFAGGNHLPAWLRNAMWAKKYQEDLMYQMMVDDPDSNLEYTYWTLPVPPKLKEDDFSFIGFMKRLDIPDVDTGKAVLPEEDLKKIHWLHNVGGAVHFSQAYVSKNWYQGGNNHLSLLFNFNWNVQLNQVYHPKLLFQSSLSYKLGLNSTPQDSVHSYSISEDLLQYNLNAGWKAFKKWFYSFNMLFKTQILRNYESNSMKRKASFLSPGDFNLGLGMAYSHQNEKKTFQFTATLSPLSYNLKTCISSKIDHGQFNISPSRKSRSEIGSNGEFNMNWQLTPNISYKSRVFLFTDYDYFLSDWENTFTFNINKFLSTQVYVHFRYDSSSEKDRDWNQFMMREILSFGLSYTWSTK